MANVKGIATSILSNDNLMNKIFISAAVIVGGYGIYKLYQSSETRSVQKELDNSTEAQQANTLLSILHPYSYKSLTLNPFEVIDILKDKAANIDENAVIEMGGKIKDFNKVSKYYSGLTGGRINLADDIRQMLNTKEQTAFFEKVSINHNTSSKTLNKPPVIYANPNNGLTSTVTFLDGYFKKPFFSYLKNTRLGTASKLMTVPVRDKNGNITSTQLYLLNGEFGKIKGKQVYVLASQVTTKKLK